MIIVERHNKYIIIDLLILMESRTNIFFKYKIAKSKQNFNSSQRYNYYYRIFLLGTELFSITNKNCHCILYINFNDVFARNSSENKLRYNTLKSNTYMLYFDSVSYARRVWCWMLRKIMQNGVKCSCLISPCTDGTLVSLVSCYQFAVQLDYM